MTDYLLLAALPVWGLLIYFVLWADQNQTNTEVTTSVGSKKSVWWQYLKVTAQTSDLISKLITSTTIKTTNILVMCLMIKRNHFEMLAHQKQFEQYAPIAYKHRPSMGNNWPDGVQD